MLLDVIFEVFAAVVVVYAIHNFIFWLVNRIWKAREKKFLQSQKEKSQKQDK